MAFKAKVSKGKRGGARSGAGRKPLFPFEERLEIGLACQEAWRAESQKKAEIKLAGKGRPTFMGKKQAEIQAAIDSGKISRKDAMEKLQDHGARTFGKHKRGYALRHLRPYGLKSRVIAEMAEKFSCNPRMVKAAWDDLRALERDAHKLPI